MKKHHKQTEVAEVATGGKLTIAKTTLKDLDVHVRTGDVRGGTQLVLQTDPVTRTTGATPPTAQINCNYRS